MTRLENEEEQEILDAFESGNTKRSKKARQTQRQHQSYVEAMVKKGSRINIRPSSKDLRLAGNAQLTIKN